MTHLEKGKISGSQLVYLLVGYLIGSSLVIAPGRSAQQEIWLAIIIGAIEGVILALIFTTLVRRFPGKTIVEILEAVFGPFFGKAIAVIFLWYSFHLGSLVIGNFSDFFTTAIMPETPNVVFAALMVLVSAFAVGNGLEVITRCSLVLVPLIIFLLLINFVLQLNQLDFKNLLPLFEIPVWQLLKSSQVIAVLPFGEAVIFLMILPFLNQTGAGRSKTVIGILLAAFFMDLVTLRSIGALGAVRNIVSYPAFEAVKLIKLPFIDMRLEIIVTISYLTMGFLKIAALHYSTVLGMGQVFKLRTIRPLIIPTGILMVIFSLINFRGFTENVEFIERGYPIYALPFQLGIPLLTLIVAVIRKLPRRTGC